jgi:hypothetical protein
MCTTNSIVNNAIIFTRRPARLLDLYEVEESNEFIYTNEFYDVYILDDLDIP